MNKKTYSISYLIVLSVLFVPAQLSAGKIDIKKYVNSMKHLEELKVNDKTEILNLPARKWVCCETLIALGKLCPNLKYLDICDCQGIDTQKTDKDARKIYEFAKDNKCDVSYGDRSLGDIWFTAKADGRHPTIHQTFFSPHLGRYCTINTEFLLV